MSVVVLGSANLDLIYRVERIPEPGETLLATGSSTAAGGKGNNQAVAAARAGATVALIVALGTDAAGDRLAAEAAAAGVDVHARRVDGPSGTALIVVDRAGENTIVVDLGANDALTRLTAEERAIVADGAVLALQLETPLQTVIEAAAVARDAGALVVLNAAPFRDLPPELVDAVAVLVVNDHEAALLTRLGAGDDDRLAAALGELVPAAIVTRGGDGSLVCVRGGRPAIVPAHPVKVVDTTGAGDTFCGALVAELDRAQARPGSLSLGDLVAASRFAAAAAALSVQRAGAVPSIPTLEEIRLFRAL